MNDDHTVLLRTIAATFDDTPPIPDPLRQAALDAFQWRTPDFHLAELLSDSSSDAPVGVRGKAGDRRALRYSAGAHEMHVHLNASTMVVMLDPPVSATCRVAERRGDLVTEHETDEYGELVVDAPSLPVRIEVDLPDGQTVTPWIIG